MKKLFILLGTAMLFASCKTYVVSTVASSDAGRDAQTGKYVLSNDTLDLSFSFAGNGMPLTVEVYNKLPEPLYVDWGRSAMVVQDKAYSFVNDEIKIAGDVSSSTYKYQNVPYSDTYGNFNATAQLSKNESFVPPHAKVSRTIYVLNALKTTAVDKSKFEKDVINTVDGTGVVYTKTAKFSKAESPVQFRSYLTFFTVKNEQLKSFAHENSFYVSAITKTGANPAKLDFQSDRENIIVNGKATGFAKVMTGVAVIGAVGGLAGAEAALADKNQESKQ